MTRYEVAKFLHVLAVIVWVGGGALQQALAFRASRSVDPAKLMSATQDSAWAGQRFFMPASIASLLFGLWLVGEGPWRFGETWIVLGLVGYAASAIIGMALLGPLAKRVAEMAADRGPHDPVVVHGARRILRLTRLDLVILIAVVFDMVVKPGT